MPREPLPRLRPISPGTIADNVCAPDGIDEGELMALLYDALGTLPPAERAAAVVAIGFDEGAAGVAVELELDPADADALTRNALQLLRGALADIDLNEPAFFGRLERRRHTKSSDW
jgi:hypothetical protein